MPTDKERAATRAKLKKQRASQRATREVVSAQKAKKKAVPKPKKTTQDKGPKSLIARKKLETQAAQFAEAVDVRGEGRATPTQAVPQQTFEQAQAEARAGLAPVPEQEQPAAIDIQVGPGNKTPLIDKLNTAFTTPTLGGITPAHILGAAGAVAGIGLAASVVGAVLAKTAVSQAARIGTTGLYTVKKASTAATIATNTATKVATASWLSKLARAATNPNFVVGSLMAAIGSYPFAGFIKEEALQTLGFGVKTAIDHGDIEGAEQALQLQKEILDPGFWDQIKSNIPFVNVLNKLDEFYEAAIIKVSIDEKIIEDKKIQLETGESDNDKWVRIRQEQADQEKANIDYYNNERKKIIQWEQEARSNKLESEAKFWAQERAKQRKLEEADRKAIADFWFQYRKRLQKLSDDNRPSNLNFGLL